MVHKIVSDTNMNPELPQLHKLASKIFLLAIKPLVTEFGFGSTSIILISVTKP